MKKVNEEITLTEKLKKGLMQILLTKGIGHTKFKMTEIGEMPEEWVIAKVSDIYNIVTGTTPSTSVKEYWQQGKIEWVTPKDLRYVGPSLYIFSSERKITEKAIAENSLTLIPQYSIIISTRAPVGYVGINIKEATINQGCKGLIPKEPTILDTRFHANFFSSISEYMNNISGGSTFKELAKDAMGNIGIPVPNILEQRKIADILYRINNKLELLRNKKTYLERIKKGLMNDLFTGRVRVKEEASKGEN